VGASPIHRLPSKHNEFEKSFIESTLEKPPLRKIQWQKLDPLKSNTGYFERSPDGEIPPVPS